MTNDTFDDLQDLLAGLLDDKPPAETPPEQPEVSTPVEETAAPPAEACPICEGAGCGVCDGAAIMAASSDVPDALIAEAQAVAAQVESDDPMAALADIVNGSDYAPRICARCKIEVNSDGGCNCVQGPLSPTPEQEAAAEEQMETEARAAPAAKPAIYIPAFTTDELASAIDIRDFGTLVTLQTRRWHARVKDRQAARDAASASGADPDAFDTHKRLLAGADEKLKRIHKTIDAARALHYRMTLPWSTVAHDESGKQMGSRLLPNTLFMEYTTALAKAKQEMKDAIADFVPAYPTLVQVAKTKLGKRFIPTEYPQAALIASYFELSFDFMPVPLGEDFRGLAQAQVQRLSDTLARKTRVMLENAMTDAWMRLRETVAHAAERLSNPDAMFHFTMVDKLKDQASLLKHLNVTSDQRIEDVRAYVEKYLTMHDAKSIRDDEHLRRQLAKHAKVALDMMDAP